jgi:outer membrane protein assembly factor BamD (BamD/ComL family)
LLDLGRIAEVSDHLGDPTDVVEAQRYYARVRENYPNTDMAARATLLYAQSLAQSFEAEAIKQGVSMLEAEMKAQPDSAWYATIAQYTAQLYAFYLDDAKDALKPYDAAARAGFPRAADSDLYLWQYGLLAQEAGEDLIAADAFRRIVADYPRSIYGTVARQRMRDIAQKHPEALIKIPEHGDAGLGR